MTANKVRRPLAASLTAFAMVVAGIPVASASSSRVGHPQPSYVLDVNGINLSQARAILVKDASSKYRKVVQRAKHLLHLLDIHEATTAAERHELIRMLPVVISDSDPADGRSGTVRSFVVGGKTRLQVFIPTRQALRLATVEAPDTSGPVARGADDCYDGPAPCATGEEMDDLGYLLASTIADVEAAQADFDNGCAANPAECEPELTDDATPELLSGPSVSDVPVLATCKAEAAAAIITLASSASAAIFAYIGYEAAVLSGLTLTAGGLAAMAAAAFLVGFAAGFAVGYWIACVLSLPAGQPMAELVAPFRLDLNYSH